jgi:hypothetical protein
VREPVGGATTGLVLGLLLVCAVALAGCGSSTHNVSGDDLSKLVLHDGDLPPGFSSFYVGRQTRLDNSGSARASDTRFHRLGGWIARYHRAGSARTRGPLVVESRADVFAGGDDAKRDLGLYRVDFSRSPGGSGVPQVPRIGDETIAVTFTQPGQLTTRFYRLAWRDRNVTASVLVDGFDGKVSLADAVGLARQQERLIAKS